MERAFDFPSNVRMEVPRLRVALTDDHAIVRSGSRRLLELEDDIEVVAEFADGEQTIEWLNGHAVDVLVLDLSMPGQGGLMTLRRLRASLPALRVLVFTMHDNPSLVSQALDNGASGFVTKSSPPALLADAVLRVAAGECVLSSDVAPLVAQEHARRASLPHDRLSLAEFDMFMLFARGLSVEEVASKSLISVRTAANYQATIRRKTGLGSTLELYRYAQERGLLGSGDVH
ncbi:MAG TPA: response regulator transcription factor [Dokdonella sp.]